MMLKFVLHTNKFIFIVNVNNDGNTLTKVWERPVITYQGQLSATQTQHEINQCECNLNIPDFYPS